MGNKSGAPWFAQVYGDLAGLPLQDNGAKFVKAARQLRQEPNPLQAIVLSNLSEGRLPESIDIIKTDEEDDDDWVEIRFGGIDPPSPPSTN